MLLTICRMSKTYWQTWNLILNWDSKDQLYYSTHWLDISQTPRETKQEFFNVKEIITRNFIGYAVFAGREIWEEDILITDVEELENFGCHQKIFQKLNAKEVLITQRYEEFVFLVQCAGGSAKLSGRDHEFQEPTLRWETTARKENPAENSHGDREEFQPEETKDDEGIIRDFWGSRRSSESEPRGSIARAREQNHILFHWGNIDFIRSTHAGSGDCTRKTNRWLLERRWKQISVRFVDGFHTIYVIERNSFKKDFTNPTRDWRIFRQHHV